MKWTVFIMLYPMWKACMSLFKCLPQTSKKLTQIYLPYLWHFATLGEASWSLMRRLWAEDCEQIVLQIETRLDRSKMLGREIPTDGAAVPSHCSRQCALKGCDCQVIWEEQIVVQSTLKNAIWSLTCVTYWIQKLFRNWNWFCHSVRVHCQHPTSGKNAAGCLLHNH